MNIKNLIVFFILMNASQITWANIDNSIHQKIIGPQACAECHEDEAAIWNHTHHATNFKSMPRSKDATQIAQKLGILRIKTDDQCRDCHFTSVIKSSKLTPIAGVSCERCHGPARDWNDIHHDYGGKNVKKNQESAEHKLMRIQKSEAAGMIRPKHYAQLFRQCYECHVINKEALINQTGHPLSSNFELVAWTNGEIRHNVFNNKSNPVAPLSKQRLLFVLGTIFDAEYSLKGLAESAHPGRYRDMMNMRLKQAISQLEAISKQLDITEVKAVMKILSEAKDSDKESKAHILAIQDQAKQLVDNHDGEGWSSLDALLPKKFKGSPIR